MNTLIQRLTLLFATIVIYNSAIGQLTYPETKKGTQVDDYFGYKIKDPYRWLEDDNSEETAQWVAQQNEVTQKYLGEIPFRDDIKERLTEIWNYEKYSTPFKEGDYYFYYKNDGMQNQSVLYYHKGMDGEHKVFIDPNKLGEGGTTAISTFSVSNDAKYAVYGTATGGSDWKEFFVMDVATGKLLNDHLKWIKFSGASFYKDGFFYSRYDAPKEGEELSDKNEFHKVYYHKIGTEQSADELIYQDQEHPLRNFGLSVTEDERFAILYESESTSGYALYYKNLDNKDTAFTKIAEGFDYEYNVIDNIGNLLLVVTNEGAPKNQLILMDPKNPEKENWTVLIPENDDVLRSVSLRGGKIITYYMKHANSKVYVHDLNGKQINEVELPSLGSASGFTGKKEDSIAFYSFRSFTSPGIIYKYNVNTNKSVEYFKPKVKIDFSGYKTEQVFYESKDGTKIPMFIVHKEGIELNGKNPTLLYGYGGFNISITPRFSLSNILFLESGGVYASANMRGGGEYGEEWHEAGTKLKKQNVFDDFIAAAEYLIEKKYTSSEKLAISGRSNGGLLVGACMTQRPELYKVALPAVGVLDMLRFHKFTIGWAWTGDYGSSEDKEQFKYLKGYSPLHNLKLGTSYPATLVTTADHDDRVVPAHSFKFLARLQECHKGDNPVIARIETMAGHGAGKPTSKQIEESSDILSFIFYNLGMDFKK